jgi:hypothetical protein
MVPVLMMMGIGMGLTMSPMTAAVMNAVGAQRAGLGSAMTNTAREAGGVFGIALLGTLLTTQLRSALTSTLAGLGIDPARRLAIIGAAGHGTLDPRLLGGLTPGQARAVRQAFSLAFMKGMHLAFMVAAFFVIAAAVVANRFVPSGAPQDDREPSRDGDGRRATTRSAVSASAGNGRARSGARESLTRATR